MYKHTAGHWVGLGVVSVGPSLSLYTHTQKCLAIDTYQAHINVCHTMDFSAQPQRPTRTMKALQAASVGGFSRFPSCISSSLLAHVPSLQDLALL